MHVVEQLLVGATRRAIEACGLSQGARDVTVRDVTALPDYLARDLTYVVERLQVYCSHVL